MTDCLPIDIHSGKLLDWLVSRRHCSRDWQKKVVTIREKLKHAILDMPEDERIVALLQGSYINYFHCLQVIDVLRETEKDSKNFLGFYSSQRMKDWQEIEALYKKENVYLAEAAQILQRLVQYELPAVKRQIVKAEQSASESARKEKEYTRLVVDSKKAYDKELDKMGKALRAELLALASQLPDYVADLEKRFKNLAPAVSFYAKFAAYISGVVQVESVRLPKLELLTTKGNVTVFEARFGKTPSRVEKPNMDLLLKEDEVCFFNI